MIEYPHEPAMDRSDGAPLRGLGRAEPGPVYRRHERRDLGSLPSQARVSRASRFGALLDRAGRMVARLYLPVPSPASESAVYAALALFALDVRPSPRQRVGRIQIHDVLRHRRRGHRRGLARDGRRALEPHLECDDFSRLRFGVGNNFFRGEQAKYVLSKFGKDEEASVAETVKRSIEAIRVYLREGITPAMNQFNS